MSSKSFKNAYKETSRQRVDLKNNCFRGRVDGEGGKKKSIEAIDDAVKAEKSINMKKNDEKKNTIRITCSRSKNAGCSPSLNLKIHVFIFFYSLSRTVSLMKFSVVCYATLHPAMSVGQSIGRLVPF